MGGSSGGLPAVAVDGRSKGQTPQRFGGATVVKKNPPCAGSQVQDAIPGKGRSANPRRHLNDRPAHQTGRVPVVWQRVGDTGVLIVSYTWADDADWMGSLALSDKTRAIELCVANLAECGQEPHGRAGRLDRHGLGGREARAGRLSQEADAQG